MPTLRSINGEPLVPVIPVNANAAETEAVIHGVQETVSPSQPGMETEAPGTIVESTSPLVSDHVDVSHNDVSGNISELAGGIGASADLPDIPPFPSVLEAQAALHLPVITTANHVMSQQS